MLSTGATGRFSEMNLFVAFPLLRFVLHNASRLVHLCTRSLQTLIVDEICVSYYLPNVQRYQSTGTRESRSQGLTLTLPQPCRKKGKTHRRLRMVLRRQEGRFVLVIVECAL